MGYEMDIEKTMRYLRSPENKKACKKFILEGQRLNKLIKYYSSRYEELYKEISANVVREEYSVKGEIIHRGYYCPSLIQDIVIGNSNRGKILKRKTSRSHLTYKYGFDSEDRLVVVEQLDGGSIEVIVHKGDKTVGLSFDLEGCIESLAECIYQNGKISSYVFAVAWAGKGECEYRREDYNYSADGLEYVDMFDFLGGVGGPILNHERYLFRHDEEGYLSQYYVVEYEGDRVKKSFWDGHPFKVYLKRKI